MPKTKTYHEPNTIFMLKILTEQLSNAVEFNRGQTTITEHDISILRSASTELERYDRMAHNNG